MLLNISCPRTQRQPWLARWFLAGLGAALLASPAWAWGNHTLASYRALEALPQVQRAAPVRAESLDSFLRAEESRLQGVLQQQEQWARSHVAHYPPLPDALSFVAQSKRSDAQRRQAFLSALRVAPDVRLALYIQPDVAQPPLAHAQPLRFSDVSTLPEPAGATQRFVAVPEGQLLSALAVVASASDEPDYGLDINCWSDSPSAWGKAYGFGPQPFGNPTVAFSSQAPFHMGFMHEDRVIYWAAPFVQRTYPLLRAHQFSTLAQAAFASGHPYWGWRFAGWALHYVQDLTQPYHARLAPGFSTVRVLWANALAMAGRPSSKDALITLLSNRHLALEGHQNHLVLQAARAALAQPGGPPAGVVQALARTGADAQYAPWGDDYLVAVVTAQSASLGSDLDRTLTQTLPAHYVLDPEFDFGAAAAYDPLEADIQRQHLDVQPLDALLERLLENFGAHSRNALRGVVGQGG